MAVRRPGAVRGGPIAAIRDGDDGFDVEGGAFVVDRGRRDRAEDPTAAEPLRRG
jgi:hypothetical protein